MNDLTVNAFRESFEGITYEHSQPEDLSLYREKAVFKKIPLYADVPIADVSQMEKLEKNFALYNQATHDVLDFVVSKSYNLVPHEVTFSDLARSIRNSSLGNERMKVTDRIFDKGARAHRTIEFPDMRADVRSRTAGDSVAPRIDLYNSVNATWAYQLFSGAYRDLCRNSCVFGGEKAFYAKKKHTKNLAPEALIEKGVVSVDMFTSQRELMDRWAATALSDEQFAQILKETVCFKKTRAGQEDQYNKGLFNYLMDQFEEETASLGHTLWAGYNALTHWSTHTDEKGRSNQVAYKAEYDRSNQVRNVLSSPSWGYLESLGVAA